MHKLTNNRAAWGRCAVLAGGLMLVSALPVRPHIWGRLSSATVSFDGRPTSLAPIYRSDDGEVLLWMKDLFGGEPYIIVPSEHWVGVATGASLWDDNPDDDGHWFVTDHFV